MPLRKVPLKSVLQPSASLELYATPSVPGGRGAFEYKRADVKLFLSWLCNNFRAGDIHPEFEIAKKLNVHRTISDEWLNALVRLRFIESHVLKHAMLDKVSEITTYQCLAIRIDPAIHKEYKTPVDLVVGDLADFDPWTDEQYDETVEFADQPWLYTDKFYSAQLHEYYLVYKQQRIRPNKTYFVPVGFSAEHASNYEFPLRSPQHRAFIDRIASGERTMRRMT